MSVESGDHRQGLVAKSLLLLNLSVAFLLAAALLIAPVAVDQIHMDDTVLLANVAWRGVNGYAPVIDYPHFYGGFAESFVTAAFMVFGVSYKAIDYAFVTLFLLTASLVWLLCWTRLRNVETSLLTALGAAIILSLDPLEAFQHFRPGHSFVYNHVGIVLMLALTVFACRTVESRRAELASALAAGGAIYTLVLLKTTFGLFSLSLVLACLVQKRWLAAGLVMVGGAVTMLVLDPTMERALGSLGLLLTSEAAAQAGGFEGRLLMASLMLKTQALPIAIVLILTAVLWRRTRRKSLPLIASLLVCGAGYSAAMLTTGGNPEHKLLPFLVVAALLLCKALTEAAPADASVRPWLISAVPIILAYSLILPSVATFAIAISQSLEQRDASLVEHGPLARYVVFDPAESNSAVARSERLTAATANTLQHIRSGKVSDRDEYVMLADGMKLLRQVDNVSAFGIISNGRMFDFTAPLQSKAVASYPVWPTLASPELMTDKPLEPDVDMVMVLDEIPELGLVSGALRTRMGGDFRPCRRSAFWTLFVRRSVTNASCASSSLTHRSSLD
jgi:hypothetical protein